MAERNCEMCIHKKPDGCEKWECEFEQSKFVSCGLELGECARQIPYDMEYHEKMMYEQGRKDAIEEMIDFFDNRSVCVSGECMHPSDEYSCVRCVAEQMKEGKQ